MKEFENKIYRRLPAPVLACLVLALAGCSQDATEAEAPSSPTGGTYLTIVTRGIVTGTEDQSNYEDYVGSLRVIAFKNGEVALNKKLTDLPNEEGTQPDTEVDLTEEGERLQIGTGGGSYTFYFIANEEGHSTADDTDLVTALDADNITAETLENMQVAFTQEEVNAPSTPISKYMLMSTKMTVYIEEGVNKPIEVVLDRALAKAQLVIQSTDKITDNISVSLPKNKIPASYFLIKQGTIGSSSSPLEEGTIALTSTTNEPFDDKAKSENNRYVSEVVYLPERLAMGADDALYYSITIGDKSFDNVASIADGTTDAANVDYDIKRNCAYTTICTYSQPATLNTLTYTVQPWEQGGGKHDFN